MTCVSVRFGNVLGSRGSVLGTFRAQANAGHDLTVTDRHAARFFMTVAESVELVIQSGAIGRHGEVLVLDMGEPVRILEVAERIAQQTQPPVGIEFSGLRPGEKQQEVLFGADEVGAPTVHPLIYHVEVPPLPLSDLDPDVPSQAIRDYMQSLSGAEHTSTNLIDQANLV